MESTPESNNPWEKIDDFGEAIGSALGFTLPSGSTWAIPDNATLEKNGIVEAGRAFRENLERFQAIAHLMIDMFNHGRQLHHIDARVTLQKSGNIEPVGNDDPRSLEIDSAIDTAFRDWVNSGVFPPPTITGQTDFRHVAALAAVNASAPQAVSGHCGSIITQGWTMFEALAEDLWVQAVNARPGSLSKLSGNFRSKYSDSEDRKETNQPRKPDSNVSVRLLERYGFNVHRHMGDILRDGKRVTFRTLTDIRDAYHRAFEEHADSIVELLDEPNLQYAAAVRNVIIHKAGRADGQFDRQVSKVSDVPQYTIGEKFPLSGKITRTLSDAMMWCSSQLVVRVNSWIENHPE